MKTRHTINLAEICVPLLCVAPFLVACLIWVADTNPTPLWLESLM